MEVDYKPLFEVLPDGYNYMLQRFDVKSDVNKHIICSFRIADIVTEEAALEWVKAFETKTMVIWRLRRTYKCSGIMNLFRQDYKCHRNTDRRSRIIEKRRTQNTNCAATLKVVIQRYFERKRLKPVDPEVAAYPCACELYWIHNHSLTSGTALLHRPMSSSTKEKLLKLFLIGHSSSSAHRALFTELKLEHENDYEVLSKDYSVLPSLGRISYLFECFTKEHGRKKGTDIYSELEDFVKKYRSENEHGKIMVEKVDSFVTVAIHTDIMQRTFSVLPEVSKVIFIEALGNFDIMNYRVYFFVSPCIAGGMPLGCIITDSKKDKVFKVGVRLLTECFPSDIGSTKDGSTILLVDILKELKVMKSAWPSSKYFFSQFHFLKSVWKWLCDPKHAIPEELRLDLYFSIKDLVNTDEELLLEERMTQLKINPSIDCNDKFQEYLAYIWRRRHLWASCYRKDIFLTETNYVELLFHIFKNQVFERVKDYNLVNLVDFLSSKLEMELRERYIQFSQGILHKSLLKGLIQKNWTGTTCSTINVIYDGNKNCHTVIDEEGESYFTDSDSSCCSCHYGQIGQPCQHLEMVIKMKLAPASSQWYSQECKDLVLKVAVGSEPVGQFPEILEMVECEPCVETEESNIVISLADFQPRSESDELLDQFDDFLESMKGRVHKGVNEKNKLFAPAVKKLMENAAQFASTDIGLTTAFNQFATIITPKRVPIQVVQPQPIFPIPIQTLNTGVIYILGKRKESDMNQISTIQKSSLGNPKKKQCVKTGLLNMRIAPKVNVSLGNVASIVEPK